ncbi:double-strand break repair protein AddB [Rhodophyticola sp. CCM32]|nr:double-strand break repair protein AddB [Rhodophyticola sp. CCM32]
MFEPTDKPRLFATPLGVDFTAALIDGVEARLQGQPPEALARVEIYVNTARMQRRLTAQFAQRRASFLPRIRPVTDLAARPDMAGLPPAMSPLRERLQLSQLIARLLDQRPDLAPRAALYALADSLADLMGEMQEERVTPGMLHNLDVGDHAQHWQRSQAFLSIVAPFFAGDDSLTVEARHSAIVDRLARLWQTAPPDHPVIVAGSTGSRGVTARLMRAVAGLPQGAVVLPGLDYDMPDTVWQGLLQGRAMGLGGEDHPQYRLGRFATDLGLAPGAVPVWGAVSPPHPLRNRLISLALRPAPVTDQWREEGPKLGDLTGAVAGLTLIEAPTPQAEATAIALRLRQAAEDGQTAALISPDRTLTRQVTAALDRWQILPDDSAGQPVALTAPGRLLRHVAEAMATRPNAEALLVLLKHPLCHSGRDGRGQHLLRSRDLELQVLRGGGPYLERADLMVWAGARDSDPGAVDWAVWLADLLLVDPAIGAVPFADHVARHLALAGALAAGPGDDAETRTGALWEREDGQTAGRLMQAVAADADAGGDLTPVEYRDLISAVLQDAEARNPVRPHAHIMIWGALEARVQGADLMILAGLNEGIWPAAPGADPWLNRAMRAEAGLRLPDRQIGLSAHDFQQAVAGNEVWLSRSRRDAETETVPSRWLNRLLNLMEGTGEGAHAALKEMRARGDIWLARAEALGTPEAPVDPAPRPSPCPPVAARPARLSVTQIEKLVRDPYAIYALKVLGLKPLDPLRQTPDARLRGTTLHAILRRFIKATDAGLPEAAEDLFNRLTAEALEQEVPWPVARRLWQARMARIAPWFVTTERDRRAFAAPHLLEIKGKLTFPETGFTLSGTADRLDRTADGALAIYDYKTGSVPSADQERYFNKQLWLEAMMARGGAFGDARQVARIAYIGLGSGGRLLTHEVTDAEIDLIATEFDALLTHYAEPATGYTARRAMAELRYAGDYDHLARYGEWDETTPPQSEEVGG